MSLLIYSGYIYESSSYSNKLDIISYISRNVIKNLSNLVYRTIGYSLEFSKGSDFYRKYYNRESLFGGDCFIINFRDLYSSKRYTLPSKLSNIEIVLCRYRVIGGVYVLDIGDDKI